MMKFAIVCIRDRVADVYNTPYCVPSVGVATRSFKDEVNRADDSNQLYKHPDDFDLFHIGYYSDQDAKFELFESPVQIALGRDLVAKE